MPLISPVIYDDGTRLHLWRVTESCDDLLSMCASCGIDADGCKGYKAVSRRVEYMVERLLLAEAFGGAVELRHNADGAPRVDCCKHISISHTPGLIGVAVSELAAIGIDMEHRSNRVLRVRSKFLDDEELGRIAADDADANLVAWTAKEAMYKLVSQSGVGLRDDLHVHPFAIGTDGKAEYEGSAKYGDSVLRIRLMTHFTETEVITCATVKQ